MPADLLEARSEVYHMPNSCLGEFVEEVAELNSGARSEPSTEMWAYLVDLLGQQSDRKVNVLYNPRTHASSMTDVAWAILRYGMPELETWQRERLAGFMVVMATRAYHLPSSSVGVSLGRELVERAIVTREDYDPDRVDMYEVLTIDETLKLMRALGFTNEETARACRLALGGAYDELCSNWIGQCSPITHFNTWYWEYRRPLFELIELCDVPY